ncbi:MAG: hypothetical protein A2Y33_04475 [Spirochaetes bacterium GWF1_51_8]|nr:MAG: hypothetical protein A2Y33_04475 [Spirochaetes bacterium GWF1_51_8]
MELVITCLLCVGLTITINHFYKNGRQSLVFSAAASIVISLCFYLLFRSMPILIYVCLTGFVFNLVLLSLEDMKNLSVTDWQIAVFGAIALLLRIFLPIPILATVISAAGGFLLFFVPYLVTRREGIGIGDVLVMTGVSLVTTPVETVLVFLFTAFSATIYGAIRYFVSGSRERIPLIPFIAGAAILVLGLRDFLIPLLGLRDLYNLQFLF